MRGRSLLNTDEPFSWNTPASRAFLRSLMNEQEALLVLLRLKFGDLHAVVRFSMPNDPRTTLKTLQRMDREQENLRTAYDKARTATHEALEALASEMQEEIASRL